MEINSLVGQTVLSAQINETKDIVILDTDRGRMYLTWVGDCCAQCFLANFSGSANLVGSTILHVEHSEWKTIQEDSSCDVIESMGTKMKTSKGYVDFESRVSHNGYYGGWIEISDNDPLDQYGKSFYITKEIFSTLQDY